MMNAIAQTPYITRHYTLPPRNLHPNNLPAFAHCLLPVPQLSQRWNISEKCQLYRKPC